MSALQFVLLSATATESSVTMGIHDATRRDGSAQLNRKFSEPETIIGLLL